jgi:hypothetical protein
VLPPTARALTDERAEPGNVEVWRDRLVDDGTCHEPEVKRARRVVALGPSLDPAPPRTPARDV